MTSLRQIAANQANGAKSTGPNTPEGIDRASGNATKHGLTSHGKPRDTDSAAEFQDRIDSWIADAAPEGEFATWLVEVMAIESGRYLNCRILEAELRDNEARRAETSWDLDRKADVELLAKKLAGDPAETLTRLRRSKHGVLLLKGRWEGLLLRSICRTVGTTPSEPWRLTLPARRWNCEEDAHASIRSRAARSRKSAVARACPTASSRANSTTADRSDRRRGLAKTPRLARGRGDALSPRLCRSHDRPLILRGRTLRGSRRRRSSRGLEANLARGLARTQALATLRNRLVPPFSMGEGALG